MIIFFSILVTHLEFLVLFHYLTYEENFLVKLVKNKNKIMLEGMIGYGNEKKNVT